MAIRDQDPLRSSIRIGLFLAAAVSIVSSVNAQNSAAPQAAAPQMSKEEADGIIFERQQIMTQLEKDSDTMGQIVAGLAPADQMPKVAAAIAKGAQDSVVAFRDKVPGGRAKPEVWSNNADFSQRMQAFAQNADKMAQLAKGGDVTAVTSVLGDAMPCKQCHDVYRVPKKPS